MPTRNVKIALVGGGSYTWTPKLIADLARSDYLSGSDLCLIDLNPAPLKVMERLAQRYFGETDSKCLITTTTDLGTGLDGAGYVMVAITTGGLKAMRVDLEAPERYGIFQPVGDTVGPGGLSRALRNVPVFVDLARQMERRCRPGALMLNVSNPLTPLTRVVNRETSIRAIGLCHGVDHHARHLAALAGAERPEEADYVTAGIDHCPWLLKLKVKGRDAGEVLLEMGMDEWLATPVDRVPKDSPFAEEGGNRAAFRLWRELGHMPGISDRHITEFFPHFLKDRETIARYGIRLTTIRDREQGREAATKRVEEMASGRIPLAFPPTSDNVVGIVEALEGGARLKDSVNAPNIGQVSNLPEGAVVETLCLYDTAGRHPITAGPLPPVLRAIVEPHLVRQELAIDAALEGDRRKALQALIDDPRVLDVDIARPMLEALLEGNRAYLPRFF